jgi:hypothetical protein
LPVDRSHATTVGASVALDDREGLGGEELDWAGGGHERAAAEAYLWQELVVAVAFRGDLVDDILDAAGEQGAAVIGLRFEGVAG